VHFGLCHSTQLFLFVKAPGDVTLTDTGSDLGEPEQTLEGKRNWLMCGIAGFIDRWNASERRGVEARAAILDRMCRIISHRGPDDQGTMVSAGVALGMRRLSIIDLAGGHQPISGEDGSVTIVFNGEIYNFLELKSQLEARGHRFKTDSDTEAIVHAYEEFGDQCLEYLRGMYAFAIWDDKAQKLFIARDRAGKKPLYYTVTPKGTLVFGSELKALLKHPDVRRELDIEALDAYITLSYVPDPLSIFRHVHKLPPGYCLTFSEGVVSIKQYWDFDLEPAESGNEKDYIEELRALLDESVRFLDASSGGLFVDATLGLGGHSEPGAERRRRRPPGHARARQAGGRADRLLRHGRAAQPHSGGTAALPLRLPAAPARPRLLSQHRRGAARGGADHA